MYFKGWFSADMRDKKVHSYVFAVHKVVNDASDLLWHPLTVQVEVVLQGGERGGVQWVWSQT